MNKEKDIFKNSTDNEEVPYLNNDSDFIQDLLKNTKKVTKNIQKNLNPEDNIINIDFSNKKNASKN